MYFSKSLAIYRNKGVQDKNLIMNGKIRSTDKCMKLKLSHKMIYWVHYEHALMKYLLYIFCDALNSV